MKEKPSPQPHNSLNRERYQLLRQLGRLLEVPMALLGLLWLVLIVIDLTTGLSPLLQTISTGIWVLFVLDFGLKFTLAPQKIPFLRANVITLISLAVPALRFVRLARSLTLLRSVRAVRGVRLVKLIGSANRGLRSLSRSFGRRGFGYVLLTTLLVTLLGSAGMYAFENGEEGGFKSFGEAVWWTLMLLSSLGSDYWPRSAEGRILCFLLSLFGLAVFGYFTASLATYFVGKDAEAEDAPVAGTQQIEALHLEVAALRKDIQTLLARQATVPESGDTLDGVEPEKRR